MGKLSSSLNAVAISLWVGGLWVVGYMVAPVLFSSLSDRMLAGMLAGKMFEWISFIGIVCGVYLLVYRLSLHGTGALKQGVFWMVLLMLLLTVAGHFGIQPLMEKMKADALPRDVMESVLKDRFRTWHGVSSVLYLIESVLGLFVVVLDRKN